MGALVGESRGRQTTARWWQARLPPIWETQTVTLRAIMRIENMRTGWIWWSQAFSPCTGGSRAGFCSWGGAGSQVEGLGSDTGEVAVVEPPGAGAGASEVALDTGEVVVAETPGAGAGASEVALDTGGVVIEETARPGRDGAVEIAVTWRETILLSVGGGTGLLVVILALLPM